MTMRAPLAWLAAVAALGAGVVAADQPVAGPAVAVTATATPAVDMDALPPIRFVGGVVGDELYNRLLQAPRSSASR
jgi:hypothetical protein